MFRPSSKWATISWAVGLQNGFAPNRFLSKFHRNLWNCTGQLLCDDLGTWNDGAKPFLFSFLQVL